MSNPEVVLAPTSLVDQPGFELSVHKPPKALTREAQHIFPNTDLDNILVIPTLQKSKYDLVNWGGEIDVEKDMLLEEFFKVAKPLCTKLREEGYWADYIDPCSGLPMLTEGCNKVFSEVDCMEVVLGYKSMNCGCCKVLLHPRWGSFVYPATIMTTAPTEALLNLVNPLCK